MKSRKDRVYELLKKQDGLTLTDISYMLDMDKRKCFEALKKLFNEDKIQQVEGQYWII